VNNIKRITYAILLLIVLTQLLLVVNIALAQNYSASLADSNDGIGISNGLAYFLIGEDNWSVAMFKRHYTISTWLTLLSTLFTLILLAVKVTMERKAQ